MSEEVEIDKLEKLINRCNECKFATCENCEINWTEVQAINGLLDLYQHKKGRVEELKKELVTEKEKNKELQGMLQRRIEYTGKLEKDLFENASNYVISKDKIRAKIEEIMNYTYSSEEERDKQEYAYDRLKELLEEE